MSKDLEVSNLLDCYGSMLNAHQRDFVDLYYNEDLSLAEIAEHKHITRQGVRDNIKRGETCLLELESKLHMYQKQKVLKKQLGAISELAKMAGNIEICEICDSCLELLES